MTSIDLITLIGGTAWLVILMTRQAAAFRVTKSHTTEEANP